MDAETKPIPSIPGAWANSLGLVKLPERTAPLPGGGGMRRYSTQYVRGAVTKASKGASHKYFGIYNRRLGNLKVHRLVCEAFHGPPPFPRAVVIHLDEDGLNNRPENLKWGTQKENLNMPRFIEYCKSRTGENNPHIKGRLARACA